MVADHGVAGHGGIRPQDDLAGGAAGGTARPGKALLDGSDGWSDPRQVTVTLRFQLRQDGTLDGDPAVVEFPATPIGAAAAKAAMRP